MARSDQPRPIQDILVAQEPSTGFIVSPSVARTATHNSSDLTNRDHIGAYVFLDINAGADSSCSLALLIQAKSPGGSYVDIFTGSSFVPSTGASVKPYLVYPNGSTKLDGGLIGITSAPLPQTWRARVVHGNTRSVDYSIEAMPL